MIKNDLIKLMQENPEEFNRQREKYDYPELIIENINNLEIKNCNLRNIIFKLCKYGTWTECNYGTASYIKGTIKKSFIKHLYSEVKEIKNYESDIECYLKIQKIKYKIYRQKKYYIFYKTTRSDHTDFKTGKILYKKNKTVEAPDWDKDFNGECGNALHVSPTKEDALDYHNGLIKRVLVLPEDMKVFPTNLTKIRVKKCIPID